MLAVAKHGRSFGNATARGRDPIQPEGKMNGFTCQSPRLRVGFRARKAALRGSALKIVLAGSRQSSTGGRLFLSNASTWSTHAK